MDEPSPPPTGPAASAASGWLHAVGQWCWHLFVLPEDEALPWPVWVKASFRAPVLRLAARLGVSNPKSIRSWVLSVVLLDPPVGSWSDPDRTTLPLWRRPLALPRIVRDAVDPYARPAARAAAVALDRYDQAVAAALARRGRAGRWFIGALFATALLLMATTPLDVGQQLLVLVTLWLASVVARELPTPATALILVAISLIASSRYIWWRITQTLTPAIGLEWWLAIGLLAAEFYTWTILALGYLQNARPLGREPAPLPADRGAWPTVDVLITTYNEPLAVIRATVLAALGMDWPADKLTVWLLDDGRRTEFRDFAAGCGARYLTRADNRHAKAGNLNHALAVTGGEFVAIFDCDHIPVRAFLTTTMGWFRADPRCALVQTPHHFFSPDPFERNLGTFRRVPNEGGLFYGLVQDGNDLWNAAFFCGSCAVLRRESLAAVGGIATDTVTEDAHTALKLHRHGYTTAYLRRVLAGGLATESLASHIGQRVRWARGMAQIIRIDSPLTGKGLTLAQRLCYLNAMLHFFSGLPRLAFLTAPLAYLFFEFHVINAAALTLAVYALPHLAQSAIANSHLQRQFRHSVWNEAYEAALSWYISLPALVALASPRLGRFNVTPKGGLVAADYFDWRIAAPYLALVAVNVGGALIAVPRLLFWNDFEAGTVAINLAWTLFNLALLGVVLGVAAETRQVRARPRVAKTLPARLHLPDGRILECQTADFSMSGARLTLPEAVTLAPGTEVRIGLADGSVEAMFEARAVFSGDRAEGFEFGPMPLATEMRYVQCTFARPDVWRDWSAGAAPDRPLASLAEVLSFGAAGYGRVVQILYTSLAGRLRRILRRPAAAAL